VISLEALTNALAALLSAERASALTREDMAAVTARIAAVEQALAQQEARALELVISSNRTALLSASIFGAVGLLGVLIAAYVLVRAFNRFSDVVLTLPITQQIGRGSALPALATEDFHPSHPSAVEQVSARFLGAIEQLEKRIRELELSPRPNPGPRSRPDNGDTPAADPDTPASVSGAAPDSARPVEARNGAGRRVHELLGEGERLMHLDQFEEALEQFDLALGAEPGNADALIKRGMALEKLQRMEAALESYDRAIAANGSLTLAYLHKGAVCNRLQRYREALECYERALQAEQR
jgi:tetratricopeptide (TPR) repeat protein